MHKEIIPLSTKTVEKNSFEDHVTPVLAISYILFPATRGFDWFISLTTRDVVPEDVDVAISVGTGLLVPEPEGVSYREF